MQPPRLSDRGFEHDDSGRAGADSGGTDARAETRKPEPDEFSRDVERALRRAARRAREVARPHEAPVLVWKDGKVVAVEP
jgi:hypothetical protein